MRKKILSYLLLVSACGIILSTAVFYIIQTVAAQASADKISQLRLFDARARIELNNRRLLQMAEIAKEDSLESARAVALLIEMEPGIIENSARLEEIAAALNIDEIDIIDENGILRWGTKAYKFGTDFADSEQMRPFLEILKNPSAEISQEPLQNAESALIRRYAGVALRHVKGAVVVGTIPQRLLEQLEEMDIAKVLGSINVGEGGYVFSVSNDTKLISSHPNPRLVGTWFPVRSTDSGYMEIDGQNVRYHANAAGRDILIAVFPASEMFAQRTFSTVLFLIFTIALFALCCVVINLYLRGNVVGGVYKILHTLDEISGGNLDAYADVRSNTEFSRLSDGINEMLTSIKSKINEVSKAVVAAEEASKAKSSFLANMSHEIRTPMNGIIGMTDLLLGERLSGHQLQYVKDIKTSAESLLEIINDILDLSKISEGKLAVTPVDVDLGVFLKNIASMMSFSAGCKDLTFIEDIQISMPEYIRVDDVRLKQILVNLISNAIKFTDKGYVKLLTKIEGGHIIFEVSDTGVGIRADDISIVFNAFEQVDQRKNRTIKGTGLGLSITKSLVELMGGEIWVESEYGAGTTFYVTIPYERGDKEAVVINDSDFNYIYAPTAHVLLVDDIQTNRTVGAGLLRLSGINADVAPSGADALELIKAKDYDLIFMDHMMPEMDGIETLNRIRDLGEKYRKLPIIALTANAVNESRDFLLASGMDDFLSKPIDKGALTAMLQKWLPESKIEVREANAEDTVSLTYTEAIAAVSKIDGIDLELALSRVGMLQDVLETSIKQLAFAIDKQLEDMEAYLGNSDLKGFTMLAHGLKGALANIGATSFSELSAELEHTAAAGDNLRCSEKFPGFSRVMKSLSNDLKAVFPQRAVSVERGDTDILKQKTSEAIACLNGFEAGDALRCLKELEAYTFGENADSLLGAAKSAIEAFSYEKATLLLKQILELGGINYE